VDKLRSSFASIASMLLLFLTIGCDQSESARTAPSKAASPVVASPSVKPETQFTGAFVHRWPDEGSTGITTVMSPPGEPFYGFAGSRCSSTSSIQGGKSIAADYTFSLVDHRDGKDIYHVARRITAAESDGRVGTSATGAEKAVTVEYPGEPVTVFDDELGQVSIQPAKSP
jgi:hypothetical protein